MVECRHGYDRRPLADVPARPARPGGVPTPLATCATCATRLQDDGRSPHALALSDRIVHAPPAGLGAISSLAAGANAEADVPGPAAQMRHVLRRPHLAHVPSPCPIAPPGPSSGGSP